MKTFFKCYNSVAALAATLEGEPKVNNGISIRSAERLKSFAGVSSIEEAKDLLINGDNASAAKIKAAGEITPPAKESKPRLRNAVVGCLPNVPNYLRGVPTQMFSVVSTARKKPVINIIIEATIYDGINETALAQKCNALANAIAAVELAGYRINLFAAAASHTYGKSENVCGFVVNIKEADAPLNLLAVAFPLMNKAFCRAIYMRWVDVNVPFYMPNYGYVCRQTQIKENINVDGVFFSLSELVNRNKKEVDITNTINEYITAI